MAFIISVWTLSGHTFILDVKADDTIKCVKTKIQDKEGICTYQQKLIHDCTELEDGHTLSYYNIQKESILNLIILPSFWIEIKFREPLNILKFEVSEQCTPDDIKQMIFRRVGFLVLGLHPCRQVLSLQMEQYDDFDLFCDGALADHGVHQAQDIYRMYCEPPDEDFITCRQGRRNRRGRRRGGRRGWVHDIACPQMWAES